MGTLKFNSYLFAQILVYQRMRENVNVVGRVSHLIKGLTVYGVVFERNNLQQTEVIIKLSAVQ